MPKDKPEELTKPPRPIPGPGDESGYSDTASEPTSETSLVAEIDLADESFELVEFGAGDELGGPANFGGGDERGGPAKFG